MRTTGIILIALMLAACGRDASAPSVPASLSRVGADTLRTLVGAEQAVSVKAADARGRGVAGVVITWTVGDGGGSTASATSTTDSRGEARVVWTLGRQPGRNGLTASAQGLTDVAFTTTTTAGPPASLTPAVDLPAHAEAGSRLVPLPAVVVRDAYGNPVANVLVTFAVEGGGGIVAGATPRTDADGRAEVVFWELGKALGTNRLTATAASLPAVAFAVNGIAGAPATLTPVASGQTGTVGLLLGTPPGVIVLDQNQNVVAGVTVTFTPANGSGTVQGPVTRTSDEFGLARVDGWRLGTAAGTQSLIATAAGRTGTISAIAVAGPAARVHVHAGDGQSAAPGTAVPVPPAVRVEDEHGNAAAASVVTFTVTSGGGSVAPAQRLAAGDGTAALDRWTLGSVAGPNTLTASVPGAQSAVFTAQGVPGVITFNMSIDAVHLNQGSQVPGGTTSGVASRPALLRVVARANQPNTYAPPVRVRFYQGASLLREVTVPAAQAGVPTNPSLYTYGHTWNVVLQPSDLVPGLAIEAVIDPAGTIPVMNPGDRRFPRGSGTASLDVAALHPLRINFIPIHSTMHSRTGAITAANMETYLTATRQWIPGSTILANVRAPYTTQHDLSTASGWSSLLSDIQAVRTLEGARDEYYHGIIGDFPGIAHGGLAYRPGSPSSTFRSGLSYDRLPHSPGTIAHELGHNMGRMHTPCGNPANVDPNYPHENAALGTPGWDILASASTAFRAESNLRDYMSYCTPRWTSDYSYAGILQWRRADPLAVPAPAFAAAQRSGAAVSRSGVLVFGRISARGVVLNPALVLSAPPALPERAGPHTVRGMAADGTELFRVAFEGVPVEDGDDPTERHFAWFVPLDAGRADALARIELVSPRGSASRSAGRADAPTLPGARDTDVAVERAAGDWLRVRWDAERYPLALVRDRATGHVLALARGGTALVQPRRADVADVEVILSDGVRTRVSRP